MSLVYDNIAEEIIGRTLTDDEYANITAQELLDAIDHSSWTMGVTDTAPGAHFTVEMYRKLHAMTATELEAFIEDNDGVLVCYLTAAHPIWKSVGYNNGGPHWRNVFPLLSKGPRKGYPNFKKEPDVFEDRWYLLEFQDEVTIKEEAEAA